LVPILKKRSSSRAIAKARIQVAELLLPILKMTLASYARCMRRVVPVVLYPMNLKTTANFSISSILCPLGVKAGGYLKRTATWNQALYPIGEGVKQAIDKARLR
jgi:hypothetical protein